MTSVDAVVSAFVAGLLTGLSLIVAIGAQNAYVLRQGLARAHVGVVVAICSLSDVVLIADGVTCRARAAASNVPWSAMATSAASWEGARSMKGC